ncbi:WavE lipopolysaccharide synthesis family protein [Paracoccus ravus]|uniref:WavE lipopolysaccharide synthesis family protein n=1 Tax=Paracoccus ravus TaxID=2447760 RepID=UPI0014311AB5|nr:WavE lipopolysaccharide synthesis family protein [Paracoccus ravus]
MAIFMQGPIANDYDFTLETLRIYADAMPGCRLILSTWQDTPPEQLDAIAEMKIKLVLSEKPQDPGYANINMQITTAAAGVRQAAAEGATWVLKTRTDQRLYQPDVMSGLAALAKSLPLSGAASDTQKHRIFGIGQGTLKFGLYHLSDQTVFGHVDDMLAYWTPPLDTGQLPADWSADRETVFRETPIGELFRYASPESYLASQFLARQGRPIEWTISDSWAAFRDHFGTVDYGSTDFYWVKGQSQSLWENPTNYRKLTNRKELTFLDWMQLYAGHLRPEDAAAYEPVLLEKTQPFVPDLY